MRFFFWALIIVVGVGLLFFAVTNRAPVTVTLGQVDYPMSAWELALGAFLVGAVLASIVAIVEGAAIRLDNRRLRREIHKMETELNFLRTQPPRPARPEPDALETAPEARAALPPAGGEKRPEPPSAPVYDTDPDDWPPESEDDDAYSGGRAV